MWTLDINRRILLRLPHKLSRWVRSTENHSEIGLDVILEVLSDTILRDHNIKNEGHQKVITVHLEFFLTLNFYFIKFAIYIELVDVSTSQ